MSLLKKEQPNFACPNCATLAALVTRLMDELSLERERSLSIFNAALQDKAKPQIRVKEAKQKELTPESIQSMFEPVNGQLIGDTFHGT